MKIKCSVQDRGENEKAHYRVGENICKAHYPTKGLASRLHKDSPNATGRKSTIQLKPEKNTQAEASPNASVCWG